MTAALKPLNDALDILFGKQLNSHFVAWRERVARASGSMSRSVPCDTCGEKLFAYYACGVSCPSHPKTFCQTHFDMHYALIHNPETHAMEM
jgi:hypothetical protein